MSRASVELCLSSPGCAGGSILIEIVMKNEPLGACPCVNVNTHREENSSPFAHLIPVLVGLFAFAGALMC